MFETDTFPPFCNGCSKMGDCPCKGRPNCNEINISHKFNIPPPRWPSASWVDRIARNSRPSGYKTGIPQTNVGVNAHVHH